MSKKQKKEIIEIKNDPRNPEGVIGNNDIFQMLQKICNGELNNRPFIKDEKNKDI